MTCVARCLRPRAPVSGWMEGLVPPIGAMIHAVPVWQTCPRSKWQRHPAGRQQAARGEPLTITDRRMTRFHDRSDAVRD